MMGTTGDNSTIYYGNKTKILKFAIDFFLRL